ncbi:MAG TPA: NAD(P)H-dependent oxidoreductase, partial [Gammaproteobacteria bacterium]
MELLAIPGSIRSGSYNLALLYSMSELSSQGTNITVFDRMKDIPPFDPDIGDVETPEPVAYLMAKIRAADGVI